MYHTSINYQLKHQRPLRLKLFINGNNTLRERYKKYIDEHNYKLLLNSYPDSGFDLLTPEEIVINGDTHSNLLDLKISSALFKEKETPIYDLPSISVASISTIIILMLYALSWYTYIAVIVGSGVIYIYINLDKEVTLMPIPYKLYPRSSMGSKTPLRLSNSVGIIDSGYRGNLMACIDNKSKVDHNIKLYERIVQIVAFNGNPIFVELVENHEDLGLTTRGSNGFGSTGK